MSGLDLIQGGARAFQRVRRRQEGRAQRGDLDRGQVPGDAPLLWQIGGALRPPARRQARDRVPAKPGLAAGQRQKPGQHPDHTRLARTIRPHHGDQLAGGHRQIDHVQHRPPAQDGRRADQRQGAHSRHARAARQAIIANRGAPTRAVNTPSFSS